MKTGFEDVLQIESALERMFSDKYNHSDLVFIIFITIDPFQSLIR